MNDMNCPNCNGELSISDDKTHFICKHCDSIFEITKNNPDNVHEQVFNSEENSPDKLYPAEALFDFSPDEVIHDKAFKAWSRLCGCINDGFTIDEYMLMIDKIASNKHSDIYTKNAKQEYLNIALMQITNQLEQEENAIFFVNQGILSKGKDGFLITNKAIYRITKKKALRLSFECLHSLFTDPEPITSSIWVFNGDKNFRFCAFGCSETECGTLLGLICTLVRECHSQEYKITFGNLKK